MTQYEATSWAKHNAQAGLLRRNLKTHSGEKLNKCYHCIALWPYLFACDLRMHLKTHSGEKENKWNQYNYTMYTQWVYILMGRQFDKTFENSQWRKVKQMQSMWLNILMGRQFEEIYEKSQWSKVEHLREHLKTHSEEKSNKWNQGDYASSQARTLREHLKTHSGEKSNKCNQYTIG